jgi:ABC-type branched-subunit amino acid transport system ATPase component
VTAVLPAAAEAVDRTSVPALAVHEVTVQFGGVTAVRSLDLVAPIGHITGLIGPNGAGKSTTFNVCSGLVRATHGSVLLDGSDLSHLSVPQRAHAGLGRTFQRIELFDSLTVYENVALGREARLASRSPVTQLVTRPRERRVVAEAADSALTQCGIADIRSRRAGALSTGQKRLVELARALAGDFRMLLLDEPSSGLDVRESEHFGELLRSVVASTGVGVLIVEHDISLIADVCDYVYVLDFGELIFEGMPGAVLRSEIVRAAYLGSDPTTVAEEPRAS